MPEFLPPLGPSGTLEILNQIHTALLGVSAQAKETAAQVSTAARAAIQEASEARHSTFKMVDEATKEIGRMSAHSQAAKKEIREVAKEALSAVERARELAEILRLLREGRISPAEAKRRLEAIGYQLAVVGDPGLPFPSILGNQLGQALSNGSFG